MKRLYKIDNMVWLYIINFISLASIVGSLYYSEIEKLAPCVLCWYQRIFIYPIAVISTIALLKKDYGFFKYSLGLAIPGLFIALYNYLFQKTNLFGSEGIFNCSLSVSCKEIDVQYLGFITIPLMSFFAFLAIIIVSIIAIRSQHERNKNKLLTL